MLKIEIKQGESIEKALKKLKRKFRDTKVKEELRERQHYTKKSVGRRKEIQKAKYKEEFLRAQYN
ncbi:30S ribosomal protein S21 [Flavobacterium sp. NRK F10]|uniref:Small ribosomal subunit protein bS21 n=1 Tax=Flavobacterium sediminis TaxID=2201181 RepID=A0A2U8QT09_9FLAO|nr:MULTISPECIES: 30S ribosomal protein S21 [Flavobacterium]AWM13293.1 30S ribosomal protein S21 [Flavobacterium sediminis]MCO6174474.1 30S ribosomal protein S21 [Flavobacterium sp. NRK F10]